MGRRRFRDSGMGRRVTVAGLTVACAIWAVGQQPKGTRKSVPPVVIAAGAPPSAVLSTPGTPVKVVDKPDPVQAEWAQQNALVLQLATELKSEVDKTTEHILSLKVVEKAQEIERLTHKTEQQMKKMR